MYFVGTPYLPDDYTGFYCLHVRFLPMYDPAKYVAYHIRLLFTDLHVETSILTILTTILNFLFICKFEIISTNWIRTSLHIRHGRVRR